MKIGYLGAGSWGFCLASLLCQNGHALVVWSRNPEFVNQLNKSKEHPNLLGHRIEGNIRFTTDMKEALQDAEFLVESVTSSGIREVFKQVKAIGVPNGPIVLTSKGIEQKTGLLLSDVVIEELGADHCLKLGYLSGPSHAEEAIKGLPTSVVCSSFDLETAYAIQQAFTNATFRVYPNADIKGVEFGGAMKNIIAIACGISDGLGYGDNSKAALMTRGLHEIRKLAIEKGCKQETINGLAGMGDLCVTCFSTFSRNYRFGRLLAEDYSPDEAKQKIGMVVEGAYSCVSCVQLGKECGVPVPITECVYRIIYEGLRPKDAVKALLQRVIKEEHL